ncbi:hypothetical protein ACFPM3_01695 [Streptomyces coeruleoprunus]|uniref:Uncharacterized protein n=1 Tax=Streptomyces coeruleoprunus TaxID=285563 RepID=A0ABV9X7S6_9ACTN
MARTAHHLTLAHRTMSLDDPAPGAALATVVLYDLRYSARSLAEARRASRRARPQRVRRRVAVHRLARYGHDPSVGRWATESERRARQRLRSRVRALQRLVDSCDGRLDPGAADAVDVPPAHHRHAALWWA